MAKKKVNSNPGKQKSVKKGTSGKGSILTIFIVALLTVAFGIYLLAKYGEKLPTSLIPKRIPKIETKTVNLYFSDDDDLALKIEKRAIAKSSLTKEIRESINTLIDGPRGSLTLTIPEGARLLGVEVKEGIAFLNFSKELSEKHPGGSYAELQTIYSIVNTVTLNFLEIKKVQLLIEGKKLKTLAGHIDISFPLGPDKDLIKG